MKTKSTKAPKIKSLRDYPEVITATERLHLLTQVALGFPRGEQSSLIIPDPKIPTAAWTWDQGNGGHKIMIGSALPSHLKPLKSGSPSAPVALKGTMLAYQHERCHALLTGRNFCQVSKALKDRKIPFQLWNAFEDLRIEFQAARTLGIKFPWHSVMNPAAPVNGNAADQMSPVAFIVAVKQAIGEAIVRDPKDEKNVQNQVHSSMFKKGPWAGVRYVTPDNCTGNYNDAVTLLVIRVCNYGVGPMDLLPVIERWLEMFPFPPGREGESIPGESGAVAGVNEEAASGTDPDEGEADPGDLTTVRPGSFSEETVSSAVATARAEILAEEGASAAEIEKATAPLDGTPPPSGAHYDPTAQNLTVDTTTHGFTTHTVPKYKCVPAYGARSGGIPRPASYELASLAPVETWDVTGDDSAQRLRSAFPGGKGHRFTSNVTDECNIERYLNRQPEMYETRNADGGTYADIILIIDGSASMRMKWYSYGLSITLGLMKLRDQGLIKRVRVVVTGPYDILLLAHPTEEHISKIEPDAGSEGLWAAYIAIVEAGWIEAERTHVIVLTDGDITDADPDKDRMHAAGVYPVGVYRGPAKSVGKVATYFDSFIARQSRDELLDDIARMFSR